MRIGPGCPHNELSFLLYQYAPAKRVFGNAELLHWVTKSAQKGFNKNAGIAYSLTILPL